MKTTEKKLEYIRLRAEGNSYSSIAQTLGISKSTCTSWERELKAEINAQKDERLRELFSSYRLTKEARAGNTAQIKAQLSILDAKKAILGSLETERLNEFMGLNI